MDLESNVKLRFLNHEDPRAWFLIDLEKGEIHEPPELLFICKYDAVHCGQHCNIIFKTYIQTFYT